MIAGLEHQDSGDIPYMTVFDNVAYGLNVRKEDKKVIEKRVKELLVNVNGILLKTISHCF